MLKGEKLEEIFDVLVVGAGPAGSSTVIFLRESNAKVLLVDKEFFPRDKPCGDGLSGKSISLLREMDLIEEIEKFEHEKIKGVLFSSPNGLNVSIDAENKKTCGIVIKRKNFDNILFEKAKQVAKVLEGIEVKNFEVKSDSILVSAKNIKTHKHVTFNTKSIVFANGSTCFASKQLGIDFTDSEAIALRAYFENVNGLSNRLEIHFVNELIPGYFWIFPISNTTANVGLGIHLKYSDKKNLKDILFKILQNPHFKDRFKNAKMISEIKGWTLPLGGLKKRKISFDRVLFVGDAAGLIDPFTGEGIGNALLSGKVASQVLLQSIKENNFSENKLKEYENLLYEAIWQELSTDLKIQKILTNKFILNLAIKNASKNKQISKLISHSLLSETPTKNLFSFNTLKEILIG